MEKQEFRKEGAVAPQAEDSPSSKIQKIALYLILP